jgi:hypothetical protein
MQDCKAAKPQFGGTWPSGIGSKPGKAWASAAHINFYAAAVRGTVPTRDRRALVGA